MLVLSRKPGERIMIGPHVTITILEIQPNQVRVGFDAPRELPIHREEVYQRIQAEELALDGQHSRFHPEFA